MLSVSRLSVTPVRGLALLHPDTVRLEPLGVLDDRRYSLLTPDGRLFDGTDDGTLVQIRADLSHDPEQLRLTFPDGSVVGGEVALGELVKIEVHERPFPVRLVMGPWAEAISSFIRRPLQLFRAERDTGEPDRNAVSIVSEASVEELSRQSGLEHPVDARRFRMLVQVAGARPHEEDQWLGRRVQIGESIVRVTRPDPRCVITTQDPDTGLRDFPTLHAIKRYRGLRDGRHLDFGVYADVVEPGMLHVGDRVAPLAEHDAGPPS
ncbi:MAG: MOSC domain-containing protein [Chloroflexota bacterium]|nr:MOSC domain-containing protein [Chloroflexota bacterium]